MCEMRLSLMLQQTLYRSRPRITKGIALTKQVAKHARSNANDATNVSVMSGGDNGYGTKAIIGGAK